MDGAYIYTNDLLRLDNTGFKSGTAEKGGPVKIIIGRGA